MSMHGDVACGIIASKARAALEEFEHGKGDIDTAEKQKERTTNGR